MSRNVVKVFAPATVANVAVGYDHLGFALDSPGDEIIVRDNGNSKGLFITKITGANGRLPLDVNRNTAGVAAQGLLNFIGESDRPLEMEIRKKMPFGSGLGSSAASAAAGVFAIDRLLKLNIPKRDLLRFAVAGEVVADGVWHADNVAPSLMGGMVLIRDNTTLDVHKIYVPNGLLAVVIYPEIEILTKHSRSILSSEVPLELAVQQAANAASFVLGLERSDFELIKRSLTDLLIEPQRKHLIPHFDPLRDIAMREGALGFSISGAGPSMFALCNNTLIAEVIVTQVKKYLTDVGMKHTIYTSGINNEGTILL